MKLCFEVLDGLDKNELEVVLVKQFDGGEFEEDLVDIDGASWVKVKTNHFNPYVLIDKLSEKENSALTPLDKTPVDEATKHNVKTGDLAA